VESAFFGTCEIKGDLTRIERIVDFTMKLGERTNDSEAVIDLLQRVSQIFNLTLRRVFVFSMEDLWKKLSILLLSLSSKLEIMEDKKKLSELLNIYSEFLKSIFIVPNFKENIDLSSSVASYFRLWLRQIESPLFYESENPGKENRYSQSIAFLTSKLREMPKDSFAYTNTVETVHRLVAGFENKDAEELSRNKLAFCRNMLLSAENPLFLFRASHNQARNSVEKYTENLAGLLKAECYRLIEPSLLPRKVFNLIQERGIESAIEQSLSVFKEDCKKRDFEPSRLFTDLFTDILVCFINFMMGVRVSAALKNSQDCVVLDCMHSQIESISDGIGYFLEVFEEQFRGEIFKIVLTFLSCSIFERSCVFSLFKLIFKNPAADGLRDFFLNSLFSNYREKKGFFEYEKEAVRMIALDSKISFWNKEVFVKNPKKLKLVEKILAQI